MNKVLAIKTKRVTEIHTITNVFIVHPEGHKHWAGAKGQLRMIGRERDLLKGSDVRQEEDGLWRVYELESSTEEVQND